MGDSTEGRDLGGKRFVLEMTVGQALRRVAPFVGVVFVLSIGLIALTHAIPMFVIVGLLATAVTFVVFGIGPLRQVGARATVYWDGVTVERRGSRRAMHFDDVKELWVDLEQAGAQWIPVAFVRGLRLVDRQGGSLVIPVGGDRERNVQMVQHLSRRVIGRCLAESRAALREDRPVSFGDVAVSREGIRVRGAFAPWKEIRLALFQATGFSLFRRLPILPWKTIRLSRVPNAWALIPLVKENVARSEIDDPLGLFGPQ